MVRKHQFLLAAETMLRSGLCVLPAILSPQKCPVVGDWGPYKERLPTEEELQLWFSRPRVAMCVVCGKVSGNLEVLDFDWGGKAYEPWVAKVREANRDLLNRLVIEMSPSGGKHVWYRFGGPAIGSKNIARTIEYCDGPEKVVRYGKEYTPRRDKEGRWYITPVMIETRGEGGLCICSPSPGYELIQGDFEHIPTISDDERELLLSAAWSLNEYWPEPVEYVTAISNGAFRPGDDFNRRGDVRDILLRHGWALERQAGSDGNEHWRRPGKSVGTSATLKDNVFYVFTTNAPPFEAGTGYSPFAVYALLEHDGNYVEAASTLRSQGYGEISFDSEIWQGEPAAPEYDDPGPMPIEFYRIPGFISEVMDHCLETAPYPNVPLAFSGALALQAFLAGRKVRDQADNRSNIYLLALAYSSVGKDWPRKLNTFILHQIGLVDALGEKFASGEGIQDSMFRTPAMLFQTDEIDSLLQSINKAQDARHEGILSTLLTMYSASNSVFPMRRKAGKEAAGAIDQPCLVIFGTAIPTHYYEALSERMLTNGFFARMLVIESGSRSQGQEPKFIDPPPRIMQTAQWWANFCPGTGNLDKFHPQPAVVEASDEARAILVEARRASEAEYAAAEARSDAVGTTVWGRVPEQIRKLALIYAVSANHESPRIDANAAEWATKFVQHQARRMLYMAASHVADNPFHAECLKAIRKLRESPSKELPHSVLLKRMKMDAKNFLTVIETLCQQGDVEIVTTATKGRPTRMYRLTH